MNAPPSGDQLLVNLVMEAAGSLYFEQAEDRRGAFINEEAIRQRADEIIQAEAGDPEVGLTDEAWDRARLLVVELGLINIETMS